MAQQFFTIGYEGSTVEDFIATLLCAKVSVLVDIRELPLSRRKGFSKNTLAKHLENHGIQYIHLRGLGDPKEGRDAARSGNHERFQKIFKAHMSTHEARADLREAVNILDSRHGCLLCYERDHRCCHRSIVASELASEMRSRVVHLGVRKGAWSEFSAFGKHEHVCA